MIKIKKYTNRDKIAIIKLAEELKDYLLAIDPSKRLRRLPKYGEVAIDDLLDKINKNNGIIYIAELNNIPVGMISGVIKDWTMKDEMGCIPSKPAEILDLIVIEKYREKSIGTLLMKKIEFYFKKQGCDVLYVNVFVANKIAHNFYKGLGYYDDLISMEKIIS